MTAVTGADDGRGEGETGAAGRPRTAAHDHKTPPALREFLTSGWEAPAPPPAEPVPALAQHAERRAALSRRFPGLLLVVPSGVELTRANDTAFRFRPATDYLYLLGDGEPEEVLVMEPRPDGGHDARVYVEPDPDWGDLSVFEDRVKGALWVGPRRGLAASRRRFGLEARPLTELPQALGAHHQGAVLRGLDPAVDRLTADIAGPDAELAAAISELRLVKDATEISALEEACDLTTQAFEAVVRALPQSRSERDVEVAFFATARRQGNDTGYLTIAAAGAHATVLHWSRNDGPLRPQDLLLLDAGVETRRYYTADVTRTLPIGGRYSPEQRAVYEIVLAAQRAALALVRPGQRFRAPHDAAMVVLAEGLERLGVLPVPAAEALRADRQLYRRYSLHGVSHMLGLDVHDCSHAPEEAYTGATLEVGMVLTVEPGLYFQPHDLTVPEPLRGLGVRIEDDVLVTPDGCRVLSAALPVEPDAVEAWMARLWAPAGAP